MIKLKEITSDVFYIQDTTDARLNMRWLLCQMPFGSYDFIKGGVVLLPYVSTMNGFIHKKDQCYVVEEVKLDYVMGRRMINLRRLEGFTE